MRVREVEADHAPVRTEGGREPAERFAGAAAGIEHAHVVRKCQAADQRAQLGRGERVEQAQLVRVVARGGVAEQARGARRGAVRRYGHRSRIVRSRIAW